MMRRWIAALIVLVPVSLHASCVESTAFECTIDAQCDRDVAGAMCQPTGYCSFPDDRCASGQRYGELAGEGLSQECVGVGGTTEGASTTGLASSATAASMPTVADDGATTTEGVATSDGTTMDSPGPLDLPPECGTPGLPCCDGRCAEGSTCREGRCERCTLRIDVDEYYSCAIRSDGVTACWGSDEHGQLGDGPADHPSGSSEPVVLAATLDDIDLGAFHGCGLGPDGLLCWGRNNAGQLGLGSTYAQQPTPVVIDLPGVVAVAGGSFHTCARTEDARVWCWGGNEWGEVSPEVGNNVVPSPTVAPGLDDVTDVAVGADSTCVVDEAGQVTCWGSNERLQLGQAGMLPGERVVVPDIPPARAITSGDFHACIITEEDGDVWCWGANQLGQTGDGAANMGDEALPHRVLGITGAEHIDAGDDHVCAITSDGAACWGVNNAGQLGTPGDFSTPTPQFLDLDDVTQIRGGREHTCAVTGDSRVFCFGRNNLGQLGDGTFIGGPTPVPTLFGCEDLVRARH